AVIPGANHITILTDARSYWQIQQFIGATFGGASAYDPRADDGRILWALLGVLCAFAAAFPLIALLMAGAPLAAEEAGPLPSARATWAKLGMIAGGVVITVIVLRVWSFAADAWHVDVLQTPFTWLHMALADYIASFAVVLALVLVGVHRLLRRPVPWPGLARWGWQLAVAAVCGGVLYLAIGTLATAAWARLLVDGLRSWRFVIITLAQVPLFALFVGMFHDEPRWRGGLAHLGAFLLVCCGYVGAIALDRSLFFLSLVVPIAGLLFVAFALLGSWLRIQGRALGLASAALMAGIFAWAVAAIFPIVR
ncbi:MAG: hypothetical protein H0X24_16310, partial [Ktedonobacterales bacterium]|nr:hypothetical protein [Ktedonobacterales bacterium]